jgi:hypothetical protein
MMNMKFLEHCSIAKKIEPLWEIGYPKAGKPAKTERSGEQLQQHTFR